MKAYFSHCLTCEHETTLIQDVYPQQCTKCGSDDLSSTKEWHIAPAFAAICPSCKHNWIQVEDIAEREDRLTHPTACPQCGEDGKPAKITWGLL
jgi:predicted Zn-ribbon and HTH transcriptional regulator